MATIKSPGCNTKSNNRLLDPICKETPLNPFQQIRVKEVRDKTFTQHVQRNTETSQLRSHRRSKKSDGVFVPIIPNSKAERRIAPNIRSSGIKRLSQSKKVSINQSKSSSSPSPKRRLHGKTGHLSSLFSHTNKRDSQAVPGFFVQKATFSNEVPSLRTIKRPASIFTGEQLVSKPVERGGHKSPRLPRRFLTNAPRSRYPGKPAKLHSSFVPEIRLVGQCKEVHSRTDERDRISRYSLEYREKSQKITRGEEKSTKNRHPKNYSERHVELETRNILNRKTRVCVVSNSPRSSSHTPSPKSMSAPARNATNPNVQCSYRRPERLSLVDRQRVGFRSNFCPRTCGFHNYRCLGRWMGNSHRRPPHFREMDNGTSSVAYKQKRALYCVSGTSEKQRFSQKEVDYAASRQQDRCVIHKKPRGNKISAPVIVNQEDSVTSQATENRSHLILHPRAVQHYSRQTFEGPRSSRLALGLQDNRNHISEMGCPGSGPVCVGPVKNGTSLCFDRRQGSGSAIHQCLQQAVELSTSLDISSSAFNTQGFTSSERGKGILPVGSSEMAMGVLERRLKAQSSCSSISDSQPGPPSCRPIDKSSPSESEQHYFRGLEGTGWSKLVSGLCQDDVTLLQEGWRESTWKTYSSAWRQWAEWCKQNGAKPDRPRPQEVAAYLGFLHRIKKLAYATILVHKSVVMSIADPENGSALNSHPLVSTILKAISLKPHSKQSRKSEIWNILDLLRWLECNSPDTNSIFQVSRHVAFLLLLASGRRIHDLTLLLIDPEHCMIENSTITFWPKFGSKTDNARHRQSGWLLSSSPNPSWDLVKWVNCLLEISQNRRRAQEGLHNLFITTRGRVKAASRTVIAGWLKTTFKQLGVHCSPGSIRSAVASYDFENNAPLDHILSRGNWRGQENFFKHYCKSVHKVRAHETNPMATSFSSLG